MKFILLAAAAMIASPALAQTTTGTGTMQPGAPGSTTSPNTTADPGTPPPATMPNDVMQTTPAPSAAPMQPDMSTTTTQTTAPMAAAPADGTDPVGGYAPSGSGITGTATPGQPVTFRPSPSPSEAYPAPAPMASYPICKAGQYDNCMQASDARRRPATRRRR